MDRIATDSERLERSNLYGRAYDVARMHIDRLSVGKDCTDPSATMRRLVAIVSRELDNDGVTRDVIGWAAEDAIAGWGPRLIIRFTPRVQPGVEVRLGTHDGSLGRLGELRGRPERRFSTPGVVGQDVMILDERPVERPRQALDRRFEHLNRTGSWRGASGGEIGPSTMSNLRIVEASLASDADLR